MNRWIGGLGHDLGHAFGLPHPPACEDANPATTCPDGALTSTGYASYPNTYLLPSDKSILETSPFFHHDLPNPPADTTPPTPVRLTAKPTRGKLRSIRVAFSESMNSAVANASSYVLVSAGNDGRFGTRDDRRVRLGSARYVAATQTVDLTLRRPVRFNRRFQLTIRSGAGPADLTGNLLDGDADGRPGGDYVSRFSRRGSLGKK